MPEDIQLVCSLSGDTLLCSSAGAVACTETAKQRTPLARVHYYKMKKTVSKKLL